MSVREHIISQAISNFKSSVVPFQTTTAARYNVPRTTLQERLKGRKDARASHEHQQRLTRNQEEFLVE